MSNKPSKPPKPQKLAQATSTDEGNEIIATVASSSSTNHLDVWNDIPTTQEQSNIENVFDAFDAFDALIQEEPQDTQNTIFDEFSAPATHPRTSIGSNDALGDFVQRITDNFVICDTFAEVKAAEENLPPTLCLLASADKINSDVGNTSGTQMLQIETHDPLCRSNAFYCSATIACTRQSYLTSCLLR